MHVSEKEMRSGKILPLEYVKQDIKSRKTVVGTDTDTGRWTRCWLECTNRV